ncbi:MAG: phosphatidate cytidylyltransferase [Alphaproteobacteria bacterium]
MRRMGVSLPDLKMRLLGALGLLLPASFCLWKGSPYNTILIGLLFLLLGLELGMLIWKFRLWRRRTDLFLAGLGFVYLGLAALYMHQNLLPFWGSQIFHPSETPHFLIYLIALVVFADIGAYFSGRFFGGPLLAPRISPKKTWSGFAGGMLLGTVAGFLTYPEHLETFLSFILGIGKTAFLVTISQLGDLLESSLKRHWNVKDSSQLIPGHGGFWDRFDGLLAVLVCLSLLNLMDIALFCTRSKNSVTNLSKIFYIACVQHPRKYIELI